MGLMRYSTGAALAALLLALPGCGGGEDGRASCAGFSQRCGCGGGEARSGLGSGRAGGW